MTWIPNIRGAAATLRLNNVSAEAVIGALVVDFDRDTRDDVIGISLDRKQLRLWYKEVSFHKVNWRQRVLIDVNKLGDVPNLLIPQAAPSSSEPYDLKITSFIVDDLNHDHYPDLAIGIDVYSY